LEDGLVSEKHFVIDNIFNWLLANSTSIIRGNRIIPIDTIFRVFI